MTSGAAATVHLRRARRARTTSEVVMPSAKFILWIAAVSLATQLAFERYRASRG